MRHSSMLVMVKKRIYHSQLTCKPYSPGFDDRCIEIQYFTYFSRLSADLHL